MARVKSLCQWIMSHRKEVGMAVVMVSGLTRIMAPGTKLDEVLFYLGSNTFLAGWAKSDSYYKEKQADQAEQDKLERGRTL